MDIAKRYPVKTLALAQGPFGPGYARNRGAEAAEGEILFFVDSDVLVKPDTLQKIAAEFEANPRISALFGSYDETPGNGEFLSQYKNLVHHFVHQQSKEAAVTFWSGCGAIYRDVFLKMGGFDFQKYPRPSIEDIELGYRLTMAGYQISLVKEIQVTHLKRWSLAGLIKTDVFSCCPGLAHHGPQPPNDLNLSSSQRLSATAHFWS
jgi:GT2 family glycosyltransferase